jgi:hemerythrin-like metal-binding protein
MPLLRWNNRFLLNVNNVDLQHQHLVELLNTIYDEFKRGTPAQTLQSLVEVLIQDTTIYFALEEYWMAKISYPGLCDHNKEHEVFTARVTEIRESYKQGKDFTLNLLLFLNNWINNHLGYTNANLRLFLDNNKTGRSLFGVDYENQSNSEQ